MKSNLRLGVFGFGCVGQGLFHVLNETRGIKAEIRRIVVRNPSKPRPIPAEYFSFDKSAILDDPEINVVVELIDDADAAFEIVREALRKGKAVVTANKKMLAEHLPEIFELQERYGKPVLYEGAVCASIPIIRNLEEYYDNDLISSLEGIMNGSTNFILTKVMEEGKSYQEALAVAQQLGFAESDPTLDVRAYDPKFKLAILIAHAFGVFVDPQEIVHFGIDRLTAEDLAFARNNNLVIRLVARAFKDRGKVFALIAPQYLDARHPLATVRNEYNAVLVEGAFAEKQTFIGKGAGSYPTGSAVLSDISALTYGYRYEYKKLAQESGLRFSQDADVEVQASGVDAAEFVEVYEAFGNSIRGRVKLGKIREWFIREGVSFVLPQSSVLKALPEPSVPIA